MKSYEIIDVKADKIILERPRTCLTSPGATSSIVYSGSFAGHVLSNILHQTSSSLVIAVHAILLNHTLLRTANQIRTQSVSKLRICGPVLPGLLPYHSSQSLFSCLKSCYFYTSFAIHRTIMQSCNPSPDHTQGIQYLPGLSNGANIPSGKQDK
jgi:hypothetical protein